MYPYIGTDTPAVNTILSPRQNLDIEILLQPARSIHMVHNGELRNGQLHLYNLDL